MILSLCACGGGDNKENMMSTAIELDWKQVKNEYLENEVRAKNEYDGKIVKWTGKIYDIKDGYVTMANEIYNGLPLNAINVYLSNDDIAKLDKLQEITVVGKLRFSSLTSSIKDAFLVE